MNGSSARSYSRSNQSGTSTRNGSNSLTGSQPTQLALAKSSDLRDDAAEIRAALAESIRKSGKSRAAIADEMTQIAGRKVTERMLNGYTAESQEDYLFPAELTHAFCVATGDSGLLRCLAAQQDSFVVDADEMDLLELGRAFVMREQADEQMNKLQRRLHGRIG